MVPRTTRALCPARPRALTLLLLSFVGFSSSLAGCVQALHLAPSEGRIEAPEALRLKVAEGAQRRVSLSADARVSYYGKEGARKAKAVILARRPAALHFSVYSPTDDMLAVLASDGEAFTFFERGQTTCYGGESCPENIGRFSFFPLEGALLVDALLGGAPLMAAEEESLSWDGRVGAYLLERRGLGKVTQKIWVTHGTWLVVRIEVIRQGTLELSMAFKDHKMVATELLAHTLDMKMPGREVDLRVRLREVELNTSLEESAFKIPCPEGSSAKPLMCNREGVGDDQQQPPLKWVMPAKDVDHGN